MQTNRDLAEQAMRVEVANRQPKAHIPLGIAGFVLIAAMSPIAWLPWAWAGLVWADGERRLKKNRRLVANSYGVSQGPDGQMVSKGEILYKALGKEGKEHVENFFMVYPPALPLGKPLPPAPPTKVEKAPRTEAKGDTKKPETTTPGTESTLDLSGWQPFPLPVEFVEYLASQIHILIAATTGSGKTWLLRALCSFLSNQGHHLVIADPKGTNWGQLSPAVLRMRSGTDYAALVKDLHRELDLRIDRLQQGQSVGPHLWAVFDEWMLFKGKASALDSSGRAAIEQRLLDLIAAGRELNMHLIMVNQSHLLGDLSLSGGKNTFSSGLRDNLCTLGLGCKVTLDNHGNPMEGNSKAIDNMLRDNCLISDALDRSAAQSYHAELRRKEDVNRTYCLHASRLFVGQVPTLEIPQVKNLQPFPPSDGLWNIRKSHGGDNEF